MLVNMDFLISLMIVVVSMIILFFIMRHQLNKEALTSFQKTRKQLELAYLVNEIKEMMYQLSSEQIQNVYGGEEAYQRELNKRIELKKALKGCMNGSGEDKQFILDFICNLLKTYYITMENVDDVIHFEQPRFLSPKDMFDILLYVYAKEHGSKGLEQLILEEKWDEGIYDKDEDGLVYRICEEQVKDCFFDRHLSLDFDDKIRIIGQRIFENYKGFGAIDLIRDMDIDGVSGGVSGLTEGRLSDNPFLAQKQRIAPRNFESVWIFFKGKTLHLSFLSFGSEKELKRVCQNIYRFNKAGQLSEDVGYKVNEMGDGSRVVVVRPPFSESWAFFVRKFHLATIELDELFDSPGKESLNEWLKYMMKGGRITAVTGSQGSGKTTLLMAMIRHIYPTLTLRVQEMAFELHLRKLYPNRNILTFRETEAISGQVGLDLQKKTDGSVNILGEIATDEVSVLMLQMAQVASQFTVFTHHAKTLKDLVLSLRNSLLKCNVFSNERVAEEQVVKVLDFEIHMNRDRDGKRYIERISEILPYDENQKSLSQQGNESNKDTDIKEVLGELLTYFKGQDRQPVFQERIILEYTSEGYEFVQMPSMDQLESMEAQMSETDKISFRGFVEKQWRRKAC